MRRLRDAQGLTQAQIAAALGTSQSVWSGYENGVKKPSREMLLDIASRYGISLDWLLLGEGEMTRTETPGEASRPVPVVSRIEAGQLVERYVQEHPEDFIPVQAGALVRQPGDVFGLRVEGTSMEPWMYAGDVAVCSATQQVRAGDDVCFYQQETGRSTIKRLERWEQKKDRIRLRPLNPQWDAFSVELGRGDQLKYVMGVWRDLRGRRGASRGRPPF